MNDMKVFFVHTPPKLNLLYINSGKWVMILHIIYKLKDKYFFQCNPSSSTNTFDLSRKTCV